MNKRFSFVILLISFWGVIICFQCTSQDKWSYDELNKLRTLFESKNYFALQDKLNNKFNLNTPIILYYKAAVESAFNNPVESNRYLNQILETESIEDSLLAEIWTMKMNNFLRVHSYFEALQAADSVLQIQNLSKVKEKDIQNTRLIAKALRDIPPQSIKRNGNSELKLTGTHIDVTINGHQSDYTYDTGANYSILMESEAKALDLKIIEAGIDVGTATGKRVKGDVGVAASLIIGNMSFSNVIFLIFPDEALTFPGGFQLKGIIGFPLLEAMGELQFKNGKLSIPKDTPVHNVHNLALENLTPLVEVTYKGHSLIGRLDSGADRTEFYEPFFRRFFSNSTSVSQIDTVKSGGVGGVVEHPVYWFNNISVVIADTSVTIDSVYAHTKIIGNHAENYLYVNIGLDILNQFDSYILNFKEMAFIIK